MGFLRTLGSRSFATYESPRKVKRTLKPYGIKTHTWRCTRGRWIFWVDSQDAERAARVLESEGISVGEWD